MEIKMMKKKIKVNDEVKNANTVNTKSRNKRNSNIKISNTLAQNDNNDNNDGIDIGFNSKLK